MRINPLALGLIGSIAMLTLGSFSFWIGRVMPTFATERNFYILLFFTLIVPNVAIFGAILLESLYKKIGAVLLLVATSLFLYYFSLIVVSLLPAVLCGIAALMALFSKTEGAQE